jgi:hypothetical protein
MTSVKVDVKRRFAPMTAPLRVDNPLDPSVDARMALLIYSMPRAAAQVERRRCCQTHALGDFVTSSVRGGASL